MSDIQYKRCSKCKQEYPATSEYYRKDAQKKDGWCSYCKSCAKVRTRYKAKEGYLRCATCKKELPATCEYFSPNKREKRGFSYSCKPCQAAYVKSRYVPSSRVKISPDEKRRRKQESDRRYAQNNKEKIRIRTNAWVDANREHINAATQKWAKQHPEYAKARKAAYRAREREAEGFHTAEDIRKQFMSQNGLCYWCKEELGETWHEDHVTPLKRGGSNWPNNIVISCGKCNCSRKDRLATEWKGRRR